MNSRQFKELDRTDGEPMKFEWKTFHGFTTLQILAEIQNIMSEVKCEPEQLQGLIVFMSMKTDIVERKKGTEKPALRFLSSVQNMLEKSCKDIGRFLDLDQRRNGTELTHANRMENGIVSRIL